MPREACSDGSGALHPITGRGIERRKISREDIDRRGVLRQLGKYARTIAARERAVLLEEQGIRRQHGGAGKKIENRSIHGDSVVYHPRRKKCRGEATSDVNRIEIYTKYVD